MIFLVIFTLQAKLHFNFWLFLSPLSVILPSEPLVRDWELLLLSFIFLLIAVKPPFAPFTTWGPVIERLCSKWTTDPSDQIVCKHIVFFCLFTVGFLSSLYLPIGSYLLRHLFSSVLTLRLYLWEPSQTRSYVSCSKYSLFVTSVIHRLSLPLWRQAADSSSGVGLLKLFLSLRAHTEGRTFMDNHMRWSEQGLLWGIDSGDYSHYSASWARCLRIQPDSSFSLVLRALIFVRISIMEVLSRYYHWFSQNFTGRRDSTGIPDTKIQLKSNIGQLITIS